LTSLAWTFYSTLLREKANKKLYTPYFIQDVKLYFSSDICAIIILCLKSMNMDSA